MQTDGKLSTGEYIERYVTVELPKLFDGKENVHDKCCIPEGTYFIKMEYSPHFKKDMPHLQNVPGRSCILIHGAAKVSDVLGCIGVEYGEDEKGKIEGTKDAIDEIIDEISASLETGEDVTIEISKA
jgi:7-cyano-7-deazaguanine synthase in queuosine biosynthesis